MSRSGVQPSRSRFNAGAAGVRDLDAAISFWRDKVGFAVQTDAVAELQARGVEFTGPVMRGDDGAPPMIFFVDQGGRRFLLTERSD